MDPRYCLSTYIGHAICRVGDIEKLPVRIAEIEERMWKLDKSAGNDAARTAVLEALRRYPDIDPQAWDLCDVAERVLDNLENGVPMNVPQGKIILSEVLSLLGMGKTSFYALVNRGVYPEGTRVDGSRFVVWDRDEILACRARQEQCR